MVTTGKHTNSLWPDKLYFLLCFLCLAWISLPAEWVEEDCGLDLQEATVSVFFDKEYLGEVVSLITREGRLSKLRYCDLINFLEQMGEEQDLKGWLLLKSLDKYAPDFDLDHLTLHLTTPPQDKPQQTIDLDNTVQPDLSMALHPQPHSAYLNIRNLVSHANEGTHYLLDMDGAIHMHSWVAEGRFDVDTEKDRIFDYYEVRMVRDYPDRLTRLTIGEDQAFQPRLLSSDQIHGIKYATDFRVRPNVVTEPISEFTFLLERDALIELVVNGEEQKFIRLPAGPYDIRNFSLTAGFNEVILKITDDLGNIDVRTFYAVSGPNLLSPDCPEFSYSLGVRGHGHVITNDAIMSLFYRRGITDRLTVSTEGRLNENHQGFALGCDFVSGWIYGSADIGYAHSRHSNGGAAAKLILARNLGKFHLTGRIDAHQKRYLTQMQTLDSERPKISSKASFSGPLSPRLGNIALSLANVERWVGDPVRRGEVQWTKVCNDRWRFELSYLYSRAESPQHDVRAVINYMFIGEKYNRSHVLRYRQSAQTIRNTISGKQSKEGWADWKVSHYRDWKKGKKATDSFNCSAGRDANRFTAYYSFWGEDVGGRNTFRHNVNVGTCLAYVDGQWALGRPVSDAFALVTLHPDLMDQQYQVIQFGKVTSRVSSKMGAIVPDLYAYMPTTLDVDSEDLEFDTEHFVLFPTYRSGTHVEVGSYSERYGPLTVTGVLVDAEGKAVSLKAVVVRFADSDIEPFFTFTNEKGMFRVVGIVPGAKYLLEVIGGEDEKYFLKIVLDPSLGRRLDVGVLVPSSY